MELADADIGNRLLDTQHAFDSVAPTYDGPRGNNALIQRMREIVWQRMAIAFAPGSHLLDLGCGTGHDALHLAHLGYRVIATDWSPAMVARTRQRTVEHGLADHINVRHIGAHDLQPLIDEGECFDGAYSNFGPLNCVPDLAWTAGQCAQLTKPGSTMIFTVMGRVCPWELAHYALVKRNLKRARVRFKRGITPVNLNKHTVWTRYYTPREFYQPFAARFELRHYEAFSLFVPPPYLTWLHERARFAFDGLAWLDDHLGSWPGLRNMGDHFLIVMTRRDS